MVGIGLPSRRPLSSGGRFRVLPQAACGLHHKQGVGNGIALWIGRLHQTRYVGELYTWLPIIADRGSPVNMRNRPSPRMNRTSSPPSEESVQRRRGGRPEPVRSRRRELCGWRRSCDQILVGESATDGRAEQARQSVKSVAAHIAFAEPEGELVNIAVQLPHASRSRWSMNHAVFCVTPICFASCTLEMPFRAVTSRYIA